MDEVGQFAALRAWLLDITGLPEIIRAHPDAPRPQGRYGVLNLTRLERVNWPHDLVHEEIEAPETDGFPFEEIPVEDWEAVWSFNVYGPDGAAALARTTSAAKSPAALLQLHPLVLHRTSGVRRLPEIIENTWEERAQIDLFVHFRARHGFGVDVIETVPFDYEDFGGGTVEKP